MASSGAESKSGGRRPLLRAASRTLRFGAGLFAGLVALPVLGLIGLAGMYAVALVGDRVHPPSPDPVWVSVRGADVSAAGGATVAVRGKFRAWRMTCRDACDDVVEISGAARHLEVRSAAGDCLACRDQDGLPWFVRHPKAWVVGGRPLSVSQRDPS